MSRCCLPLAALVLLVAPTVHGASILLVIDDSIPDTDEQNRITTFQSWGHIVTTIRDSDSQANFDTATSSIDVVYVPETVFSSAVADKVRDVSTSVIVEEPGIHDDMGFSTNSGSSSSRTTIRITDNSHPITEGFPVGLLTITTSSNSLNRLVNNQALGIRPLADDTNEAGDRSVYLMEAGMTLANATGGITLTRGRRVGLPMGGGFNWNELTADGLLIVERAIDWAAVGNLNFVGGHWQFNETDGTNLPDSSGAGADGTLIDAQHDSNGILGAAIVFAADADDRVSLPHTVLNGASDITFTTWFRVTDATPEPTLISAANATNDNDFGVFVQNGNQIVVYEGEGLSQQIWTFGFPIDDDEWRHLAVVRDGTNNQLTLYLDGVSQGTRTATLNPIVVDSGGLILGEDQDSVGAGFDENQSFDGMLDEVSLYRRVLTAAEIAVLADSDGALGHWKLDDGSGTIAMDSSGNNRSGTLVGNPVWETDGWIGGSLRFAADANDRVELPHTILNEALNVTFATWFRTTNTSAGQRAILSAANADNSNEMLITIADGNAINVFDGEDTNSNERWDIGSTIADGQWRHLAVVRDNSNDEITLYLDGVSQGTRSRSLNALEVEPDGLLLGEEQDTVGGGFSATQAFDGSLDEVYLFRDALTAREIAGLHGLLGHWRFDETTGSTAADSSPGANTLTSLAAPTWVAEGVRSGAVDVTSTEFEGPGEIDRSISATIGFAGWVRLSTTVADMPTATSEVVDMQRSSANTGFDLSFLRAEQQLRFRVYDGTSPTTLTWDASSLQPDEWLHFAAEYDGAEMRLDINGELAASVANTRGLDIGDATIRIGGGLNGVLDDLVLYSRPLTSEEFAEHYGLIGRWRLDEANGSDADDSSGLGNDGAYQGGVLPGATGPLLDGPTLAAEFNGVLGDRVALPPVDFDFTDGLTMAVWYRADALNTLNGPFTDLFSFSNGASADDIWLGLDNTRGLNLMLSDTIDGATARDLAADVRPVPGVWRHGVAVVDASGNATLYHDGVAVASGFTSLPRNVLRTNNGIGQTALVYPFNGRLHDARIYNRPITREEVRTLFFGQPAQGPRIIRWVETVNP